MLTTMLLLFSSGCGSDLPKFAPISGDWRTIVGVSAATQDGGEFEALQWSMSKGLSVVRRTGEKQLPGNQ